MAAHSSILTRYLQFCWSDWFNVSQHDEQPDENIPASCDRAEGALVNVQ